MPFASSCSRAQQGILAATLVWLLLVPETDLAFAIAFGCGVASGWLIRQKDGSRYRPEHPFNTIAGRYWKGHYGT